DGQSAYLVDYARRQRAGKPVGTSTSEGLANALVNRRMNKLQQMRWSAVGAHAVVTLRVDAMNAPRRGGAVATASPA
ncbi:MAG: ISKra4 family transposase, partial [Parvibaculaceae bacterium]